MLNNLPELEKVVFFDMEWVPIVPTFQELAAKHPKLAEAWEYYYDKHNQKGKWNGKTIEEIWFEDASNHPEMIKIIAIAFGRYIDGEYKSFAGRSHNEAELVLWAKTKLASLDTGGYLCGHAVKTYDCTFLIKRMRAHNLVPSKILNIYNEKPYFPYIRVLDTAEIWSGGWASGKYTPLAFISATLSFNSSKDDIAGYQVADAYWYQDRLDDISEYCKKDTKSVAEIYKKLSEEIDF